MKLEAGLHFIDFMTRREIAAPPLLGFGDSTEPIISEFQLSFAFPLSSIYLSNFTS
jgi:hypothetical protein